MKKQTKTTNKIEARMENKPRRSVSIKKPYIVPENQYQGLELRPYEGRPGAMDFFALPSLQGGRRVFRGGAAE